MRCLNITVPLLALLVPSVLAEVIIVSCISDEATQHARDLIVTTGGKIIYEYRFVGPRLAATVTSPGLEEIESDPIFKAGCTFILDQMIPPPRPVD